MKCHSTISSFLPEKSTHFPTFSVLKALKVWSHDSHCKFLIDPVLWLGTSLTWMSKFSFFLSKEGDEREPVTLLFLLSMLDPQLPVLSTRCVDLVFSLSSVTTELTVPYHYTPTKLNSKFLQGWIQYLYLYLQISHKWILVESTCLNPLAKKHITYCKHGNIEYSIYSKIFSCHDHICYTWNWIYTH